MKNKGDANTQWIKVYIEYSEQKLAAVKFLLLSGYNQVLWRSLPLLFSCNFQSDKLRALDRNRLFSRYYCLRGGHYVLPSHHEESTNREKNVDHTYTLHCIEYPFM